VIPERAPFRPSVRLTGIQKQLVLTSLASGILATIVVTVLSRLLLIPQLPGEPLERLNARTPMIQQVLATGGGAAELRRAAVPDDLPPGLRLQLVRADGSVVVDSATDSAPAGPSASAALVPIDGKSAVQLVSSVPIVVDNQTWGNYLALVRLGPGGLGSPGVLATVFAIGLLLAAIPFWWFGRRMARSLRTLAGVVGQIASGDLAARADVHRPNNELGQLAADVNAMAANLEQAQLRVHSADEARRFTVAAISHDLRTPLTALLAHAEALLGGVSDDAQRSLEVIHERALRLKSLIDDLFELAALDASPGPWPTQRLDLAEVVRESVAGALPELESAGLDVQVDIPDEHIWALLSPGKVDRVVDNLLANARHYGAAGGWLQVRVQRIDSHAARVEVVDRGGGVPAGDRARVFERFYRGDGARGAASGGSGLGLSIAREIILRHDGRIGLESPTIGGTCVWFEVPTSAA
jgi:signal transduction histidine kinase